MLPLMLAKNINAAATGAEYAPMVPEAARIVQSRVMWKQATVTAAARAIFTTS